jgi:transposase
MASEKSIKEVAQDLGTSYYNLDRWRTQYRKRKDLAFPIYGKQKLTSQEEENLRLKKELAET